MPPNNHLLPHLPPSPPYHLACPTPLSSITSINLLPRGWLTATGMLNPTITSREPQCSSLRFLLLVLDEEYVIGKSYWSSATAER
uniref:Uncharacterized protein n=1 Tax=Timema cristinae TaxID=61476 RepID=A0A7R9GUK9_TIMCR|nr:unnamed protein product [Timema cristinae]